MNAAPLVQPPLAEWLLRQTYRHEHVNPCVRTHGLGPAGAKCKTCSLLYRTTGYSNTYFKCELRPYTHGPATDHRANWPACAKYAPPADESDEPANPQTPSPR